MLGENQGLQCLSTMQYMPKNLGLPLTLICQIITPTRTLPVRALIDPGSQITMIKKSTATELGLKGPKRTLMAGTTGAQSVAFKNMLVVNFKLASMDLEFISEFNVEAITIPKVTCDIGKITVDPKRFNHLKDIKFTEKLPMNNSTSTKVELLIGQPVATYLFKELIVGDSFDQPAASIYKIGACLSGNAKPREKQDQLEKIHSLVCSTKAEEEEDSHEYIKAWFNLENVGIEDPSITSQLTAEEQKAQELMEKNTYYDA